MTNIPYTDVFNLAYICFYHADLLKETLRKQYREINVDVPVSINKEKRVSIDDMFVELRLQNYDMEPLPETFDDWEVSAMEACMQRKPVMSLPPLFEKIDEKVAPEKLLIRGKAGVGKTTLVKHLASQWAAGQLWHDISYMFVVTLRTLRHDKKWTLGELLFDGLPLSAEEQVAALSEIRRNANRVLVVLDGLDELHQYEYTTEMERNCSTSIDLPLLLSSILGNEMLPEARVIMTSRPTPQIPSKVFQRTVEIYGFPRKSINRYVQMFSDNDEELEKFIMKNLNENPNLATFCYVPVMCQLVLIALADMYTHGNGTDVPIMRTMTQLYISAIVGSVQRLHPQLKYVKTNLDLDDIYQVVKEPLMKYARLARRFVMTSPLRLLFHKDDLKRAGLRHDRASDMQCGFMTVSSMRDERMANKQKQCWSFHHLTLHEFFSAMGFLEVCDDDDDDNIMNILQNTSTIYRHEVAMSFMAGLLADPINEHFVDALIQSKVQLSPRDFIMKLAPVFDNDPLKLIAIIYESQDPELLNIASCSITFKEVVPTEMRALSWALGQPKCPVTHIRYVIIVSLPKIAALSCQRTTQVTYNNILFKRHHTVNPLLI